MTFAKTTWARLSYLIASADFAPCAATDVTASKASQNSSQGDYFQNCQKEPPVQYVDIPSGHISKTRLR